MRSTFVPTKFNRDSRNIFIKLLSKLFLWIYIKKKSFLLNMQREGKCWYVHIIHFTLDSISSSLGTFIFFWDTKPWCFCLGLQAAMHLHWISGLKINIPNPVLNTNHKCPWGNVPQYRLNVILACLILVKFFLFYWCDFNATYLLLML